jgi:formate/nitrite transporter FocA (FNT family)
MQAGYKSTEFYLSLAAILVGAVMSSGLVLDGTVWAQVLGVVASILGALGYTVSRSYVKAVEAKASVLKEAAPKLPLV